MSPPAVAPALPPEVLVPLSTRSSDRSLPLVVLLLAWTGDRLDDLRRHDDERGDVPGWVLITLMTAGIVTVLWAFAGPRLLDILSNALDSVSGPGGS